MENAWTIVILDAVSMLQTVIVHLGARACVVLGAIFGATAFVLVLMKFCIWNVHIYLSIITP